MLKLNSTLSHLKQNFHTLFTFVNIYNYTIILSRTKAGKAKKIFISAISCYVIDNLRTEFGLEYIDRACLRWDTLGFECMRLLTCKTRNQYHNYIADLRNVTLIADILFTSTINCNTKQSCLRFKKLGKSFDYINHHIMHYVPHQCFKKGEIWLVSSPLSFPTSTSFWLARSHRAKDSHLPSDRHLSAFLSAILCS